LETWESIKLSKEDKSNLHKKKGDIYTFYLHKYKEALKEYNKAQEFTIPYSNSYLEIFINIAQVYRKSNNINEGISKLENILQFYKGKPQEASIRYVLNDFYEKKEKMKRLVIVEKKKSKKSTKEEKEITIEDIIKRSEFNYNVRVNIGTGKLWEDFNETTGIGKVTLYIPGGISSPLRWKGNFYVKDYPVGTTITISPVNGLVTFKRRPYRGYLTLILENNKFKVLNILPLEEYLKGVLPWEVSPKWPMESLKAQAIAARTYAVYHMLENNQYDVESSVLSQVYKGAKIEAPTTNKAIEDTRSMVMLYQGLPILAYFHSCNGGYKEIPRNVWGVNLPYFNTGYDPWCSKKPQHWKAKFSLRDIDNKLKKTYKYKGRLTNIIPIYNGSKHISKVKLVTTGQNIFLKVNDLRLLLGPAKIRSSYFSMKKQWSTLYFQGKGFGHGVGLSQWGAYYMSKAGKNYIEILNFYYNNIKIRPISDINFALVSTEN